MILQIHDFEYAFLLLNELQKLEQKRNDRKTNKAMTMGLNDTTNRYLIRRPFPVSSATQTFYC